MPEFKSLLLGLALALGIFSIKSGCGLAYLLSERPSILGKVSTFLAVTLTYFGLFLGSWSLAVTVDLVSQFNRLRSIFESGMVLHVIMAAGTLLWAVSLLKENEGSQMKSYGWIALVVPCPVCASSIFFTTAFLVALYPDNSLAAVLGAYAVYFVTTLLTVALLAVSNKLIDIAPKRALGFAMLFVSAYFFVTVLVAPHFAELDKIHRIAAYSPKTPGANSNEAIIVGLIIFLSFASGFIIKRIRGGR